MFSIKRFSALVVAVVLCPLLLLAQGDEMFKVIACKGKVTLQRTKKIVSIGTPLNSTDQLSLEGPVYLGLVHKSGKAIEVKAPGMLAVSDLLKQVSSKQSGMDKLVGFVVNSVVGANEKKEVSGSVERSIAVNKLRLLAPRTTKIIDQDVAFQWAGSDGTTKDVTYIFTLTDDHQNVRFKKETKETSLSLNIQQLGLEKERCYYWSVIQAGANAPSFESYCVYPVNDAEAGSISAQLTAIKKEQGSDPTALDNLMLASFFEQNGLTSKAMSAYKEAVKKGGDVEIFASAYSQFLSRLGMDYEAQKMVK